MAGDAPEIEQLYEGLVVDVRTIRGEWSKLRRSSREMAAWHRRLHAEARDLQRANDLQRWKLLFMLCCCQI